MQKEKLVDLTLKAFFLLSGQCHDSTNLFRCKKFNIVNFKLGADATEIPVLLIGFDPVWEG